MSCPGIGVFVEDGATLVGSLVGAASLGLRGRRLKGALRGRKGEVLDDESVARRRGYRLLYYYDGRRRGSVGSLLRDASPALFFIVSACEAGTAAR